MKTREEERQQNLYNQFRCNFVHIHAKATHDRSLKLNTDGTFLHCLVTDASMTLCQKKLQSFYRFGFLTGDSSSIIRLASDMNCSFHRL
jgi:hypothetical protein